MCAFEHQMRMKRAKRFCLNTVGIAVVIKFFLRIYHVIQTTRVIDYTVKRACIAHFRKTYIKLLTFIIPMKLCVQAMECFYRARERENTKGGNITEYFPRATSNICR